MRCFKLTVACWLAGGMPACSVPVVPVEGLAQEAYVKASNCGQGDAFGGSVALSADGMTMAVGAPKEKGSGMGIDPPDNDNVRWAGAVYLFVRDGSSWKQQAYVKASNTGSEDYFGASLALSADGLTLAVGAPGEDSGARGINGDQGDLITNPPMPAETGAVYVFVREGTTWVQQAYVKASNTEVDDSFGSSVALSGNGSTLAVGAPGEDSASTNQLDNSAPGAGAVYLFRRDGTSWQQQQYVKASNPDTSDWFGGSVALSVDGQTLVAGARGEASKDGKVDGDQQDDSVWEAGAAYVFKLDNATWRQTTYLKPLNSGMSYEFGVSVAISGDGSTVAVGARGEASAAAGINGDPFNDSAQSAGAAYVFTHTNAWVQQAYVKASNPAGEDRFGTSLALSGDGSVLTVGAVGEDSAATGVGGTQDDDSAKESGAVYMFRRTSTTWRQSAYVKASNAEWSDGFGGAVALSGDGSVIAVGAGREASSATGINMDQSSNDAPESGAVYLFRGELP